MKRGIIFLLGVVAGLGLAWGAGFMRRNPEPAQRAAVATGTSNAAGRVDQSRDEDANDSGEKASGKTLAENIERLNRWAAGKGRRSERRDIFQILERWSEKDAMAALAFVENAASFPERNDALSIPLAVLCSKDPGQVIGWITGHFRDEQDRTTVAHMVLRRMGTEHPREGLVLAFADGIPVEPGLFGTMMGVLAQTEEAEALRQFGRLDESGRAGALDELLGGWAEKNPDRAIAWFKGLQDRDEGAVSALMTACLQNGKYSATQLLERLALSQEELVPALHVVCNSGEVVDERLLNLLSNPKERAAVVSRLVWQQFQREPDAMVRLIKGTIPSEDQLEGISNGWERWLQSDRKAALAWAQTNPDRKLGETLLVKARLDRCKGNPEETMGLLLSISDPEVRRAATAETVQTWAWSKPELAANLVMRGDLGKTEPYVVWHVTTQYLEKDGVAAMDWITQLPPGGTRDSALTTAAEYWARNKDMTFASASLKAIGDPTRRQAATFSTYQRVRNVDAEAAERFLETEGVAPEVRQSWKAIAVTVPEGLQL